MSGTMSRFLAWLFDEKPGRSAAASPSAAVVEDELKESGGREPHWYEREQLGEGNLAEHGRLNPDVRPPFV